jgi:hypothetical protein
MRKDDDERWTDDLDLDRVRATPRGILGGWLIVAAIAGLMLVGPPTVEGADRALYGAKQGVEKVEHQLAQVMPQFAIRAHRC